MDRPEFLIELGAILVGLAILSRLAARIGLPTITLYLSAGLAFGKGGIFPFVTAKDFVQVGAEIGLVLLLFMLGLEYTAAELTGTLRSQARVGWIDLLLNFTPGFAFALLLGLDVPLAVILGGVTYVSSSGIIAKVLAEQKWTGNPETPVVVSVLVIEDLAMALFLPVAGALLVGGEGVRSLLPAVIGVTIVVVFLAAATRIEVGVSRLMFSRSDESLLLSILGMMILVAGAAEAFGLSAAVAALLAGIVLSGPAAEGAKDVLAPMRDLFAAIFFAFVGLSVDPASIPPVLVPASALALLTIVTKFATGWIGTVRQGIEVHGRVRAGAMLTARGEFSIAIAGLAAAAGVAANFQALAISYVFVMAILGPILARLAHPLGDALAKRIEVRQAAS